jgi:hypothetical protein
VLVRES